MDHAGERNGKAFSNVDQQVLRYRNALSITQNLETREQIYKGLAKCNSLSAMRTLYLGLKEPNMPNGLIILAIEKRL